MASSSSQRTLSNSQEINVYVKVMKTVALKVQKSDTIENLKALLNEKEGISEDIQDIFFAGDRLKDGQRLLDYGIQNDSTLHLILQNLNGMKLYVKIPSNQRTIEVEAMAHHTVKTIKSLVQVKEGFQSDEFTFVYDGKLLDEDMTIASLHMKNESTLHLVFLPKHALSISVKTTSGDVKLEVEALFTVGDVKAIIGSMIGVPVSNQVMMYAGKKLLDCKTLAFYDIKEDCMLEMLPFSLEIFVKTTEETVKLKVTSLYTIHNVKNIIWRKTGVSVSHHSISYAGRKLEDQKTLACYDIKDQSILEISSPSFQIFVKSWSGKTITLDVQLCETIKDVKRKLYNKLQIPHHLYSFIVHAGKRLVEDRDLASYYIQKHSTLHMLYAPASTILKVKLTSMNPVLSEFTTISDVKRMAQVKYKQPIIEVLYQQVPLKDDCTLADYGIGLNSEVTFVY